MGSHDADNTPLLMTQRQLELLDRLTLAGTPREVATEIANLAHLEPACRSAVVVWGLDGEQSHESEPVSELSPEAFALVHSAVENAATMHSADGLQLAIPLFDTRPVALLATVATRADGEHFLNTTDFVLKIAGRRLVRAMELSELNTALKRLERSEHLQRALFAISDLSGSDLEMSETLRGIQVIVGSLMYAENMFIVLYNAERDTLRFLYFADVEDPRPRDPKLEISMHSRERTLTWYVIRGGKALMGNGDQLMAQVPGPLDLVGPDSYDWLGVPMLRDGNVCGAIVVQSYQQNIVYSVEDRTLLEFVAEHILTALERKQGKDDLEQRVRLRTIELADANQVLQLEIVERQRAERLQAALFQIAELAGGDISQSAFYRRVHAIVGEWIDAKNFFIALVSDDGSLLEFPYYVDAVEHGVRSRPVGGGLSEYVIRHRRPLRGMTADILALADQGEVTLRTAGTPAVCWLGVPLFVGEEVIGLIVVQSYDEAIVYGQADQELLSFVASQIANSLQRRRSAEALRVAYAQLEHRVQERTSDLTETLNQLRDTQGELVRHEKLASLGGLVAGIAHEINTPLGICVTATTHLQGELDEWRHWRDAGSFDADKLDTMLEDLGVALQILYNNIRRAADLVHSFKQIAVDQSSGHRRTFDLAEYLDEIVLSLKPKLKQSPYKVQVLCASGIHMDSVPGALSQVITNLVMNALLHAFDGRKTGNVRIEGQLDGEEVIGLIVVQSYDEAIVYGQADQELLSFVASQIA
ncbi:MAG: GAF domain-containing protein, partial [Lysobacteraceae bacterium]